MNTEFEDLEAILNMLNVSQDYGLEVEVVQAFGNFRAAGDDTKKAASAALYEWDLI